MKKYLIIIFLFFITTICNSQTIDKKCDTIKCLMAVFDTVKFKKGILVGYQILTTYTKSNIFEVKYLDINKQDLPANIIIQDILKLKE